jgi:hypothetical protein
MRRPASILGVLIGLSGLLFAAAPSVAGDFSLRRSEASIRKLLLKEVPLGSPMTRVEQQVAKHKWKLHFVRTDIGFDDQRTRPSTVTGDKSIGAWLGDYRGLPFMVDVSVFWAFDADGKLIDIWVWKTWDSL